MSDVAANAPLRRNVGVAALTLLASTGTLVCCVLPAVMVALGAGAALAGLVTAVPQLIWLSEHKALVFGVATIMLALWCDDVAGALAPVSRRPCGSGSVSSPAGGERGVVVGGPRRGCHGGGICVRGAAAGCLMVPCLAELIQRNHG